MKLFKKIVIGNIILLFVVLIIVEFANYQTYKARWGHVMDKHVNNFEDPEKAKEYFAIKYRVPTYPKYEDWIRPIKTRVYKGSKKGAIVTIGCSYVYGVGLDENQTLAYRLNKLTNRTTYNRGVSGTGPQMVYRQLSDKNFKKEVPEAEYIIYVFLSEHITRQFQKLYSCYTTDICDTYQIKNGKLVKNEEPFWFFYNLYTIKNTIIDIYRNQRSAEEHQKGFPLFFKTMEETNNAIKNNYPNAKFVILMVPDYAKCQEDTERNLNREFSDKQIKKLEDMGIIYLEAEKLVGHRLRDMKKYRIADENHPNERFWNEVIPELIKTLKL